MMQQSSYAPLSLQPQQLVVPVVQQPPNSTPSAARHYKSRSLASPSASSSTMMVASSPLLSPGASTTQTTPPRGGSPATVINNSSSSSSSSLYHQHPLHQQQTRQYPAQVFTRGSLGTVKTNHPPQQRRRSRSQTRASLTTSSTLSSSTTTSSNNPKTTTSTIQSSLSGAISGGTTGPRYRRASSAQPPPLRLQQRYHNQYSSTTQLQHYQHQQQHLLPHYHSNPAIATTATAESSTLPAAAATTSHRSFYRVHSASSLASSAAAAADREGSAHVASAGSGGYSHDMLDPLTFAPTTTTATKSESSMTSSTREQSSPAAAHNNIQRSAEFDKNHAKTCRWVLDDLSRAQGLERRIAALTHVCECLDHNDEYWHNMELQLGAVPVLVKCLQVTVYHHDDDEIRMILSALEMVLRGSPRDVQLAYSKLMINPMGVGSSTSTTSSSSSSISSSASPTAAALMQSNHYLVLHQLFRILERCEMTNTMKHAQVSILNITKIVFYLSRGPPDFRAALCRQPDVLESLQRVGGSFVSSSGSGSSGGNTATTTGGEASFSSSSYNSASLYNYLDDVRFYRMRTIANLANVDENKILMLEYNKEEGNRGSGSVASLSSPASATSSSSSSLPLLESILRVAHWDPDDMTRQYAASALMDLASAPQNQVPMANDDKVLGTLVKMTLVEKNSLTREFAITSLQNLAFCKENRSRLVLFKDGVLLEALKQALASDLDAKARRRAAGALTNLVCDETAERMGQQKGLLGTLAIVATKDDNWDVQTRASLALTKIANCITVQMECHEVLLDALVVASLSKASNSVTAVLRVKARNPENRETMARHPGVIDTLTDICVSGGAAKLIDRDNAVRSLMHLVNETKNQKILCNKNVLDALVAGASYTDPDLEEARDSAIRALERLATEYTNREVMARHPGLLTVVAQAVERESNWEEAGRESEHGYFAKPLLMSLLVAM